MNECRTVATPLEPGVTLSIEHGPSTDEEREQMVRVSYRELIGSLMYLALYTRPDIQYTVTKLSQYNINPGKVHWVQAKHVLRYLMKTKEYKLIHTGCNEKPKIKLYSDADWAADVDQRHSYSGMVIRWIKTLYNDVPLSKRV
ncbi:secreted RxLR effector protein 161-like [Osmia bicornis bicornis]|uniref:secreted RxLR effector protein 161-like n=1 Tax=Osmia bicornis bicornis TaxID=1437191 RepID=UPI001EAEEA34|nr:secreted RxLR effector protein 161-like [Osmia bicornis bicornis]